MNCPCSSLHPHVWHRPPSLLLTSNRSPVDNEISKNVELCQRYGPERTRVLLPLKGMWHIGRALRLVFGSAFHFSSIVSTGSSKCSWCSTDNKTQFQWFIILLLWHKLFQQYYNQIHYNADRRTGSRWKEAIDLCVYVYIYIYNFFTHIGCLVYAYKYIDNIHICIYWQTAPVVKWFVVNIHIPFGSLGLTEIIM